MTEFHDSIIDADSLRQLSAALMQAGGFTAAEAEMTACSLVLSNLMGHDSHGVIRVEEYLKALDAGEVRSGAELTIERESDNSCLVDAGYGLGQVQMPRFLDVLLAKAQESAVVCGALRNCGHTGRLGEWSERIGNAGMLGMVLVNDNGTLDFVAPPGGKQGRTSTNPMAFSVPLPDGDVFSFDMATSAAAIGKVRLSHLAGEPCAEDVLQDTDGNASQDPAVMFSKPRGALLPLGGVQAYKGFGLSMMAELFSAGLAGGFAPPAPPGTPCINNVSVTVWNPAYFAGEDFIKTQAAGYCDYIRSTVPINPDVPVRVAGDRAKAEKKKRERNGIPLSAGTCGVLARYADKLGIALPAALQSA